MECLSCGMEWGGGGVTGLTGLRGFPGLKQAKTNRPEILLILSNAWSIVVALWLLPSCSLSLTIATLSGEQTVARSRSRLVFPAEFSIPKILEPTSPPANPL